MRDSSLIHYKHRTWMQLEHHCLSFQFLLECNKHHCLPFQVLLLILSIFPKKKSKKYSVTNPSPFFGENTHQKVKRNSKKSPKITTIAYNMEGCWRYLYFHILNTAKFGSTYFYMDVHHLSNMTKLKIKTLELGSGKGSTLSNILRER